MLQFRYAAESDTGRVREHNEDAGFAGPYLLCVADGVGGAAAGEVASATTAYVVSARALANPGYDPLRCSRPQPRRRTSSSCAASTPTRTGSAWRPRSPRS